MSDAVFRVDAGSRCIDQRPEAAVAEEAAAAVATVASASSSSYQLRVPYLTRETGTCVISKKGMCSTCFSSEKQFVICACRTQGCCGQTVLPLQPLSSNFPFFCTAEESFLHCERIGRRREVLQEYIATEEITKRELGLVIGCGCGFTRATNNTGRATSVKLLRCVHSPGRGTCLQWLTSRCSL